MVKKITIKSISFVMVLFIILTSGLIGCQNAERDELAQILSRPMEDSSFIVEQYPSILYGAQNEILQKNFKQLFSNSKYDSVIDSLQCIYWLALVRENQLTQLQNEFETYLTADNAKEKLGHLWIHYILNLSSIERDSILNMLDMLKAFGENQSDRNLTARIYISMYMYYQYFDLTDEAQTVKLFLEALENDNTLSFSPTVDLNNQKLHYVSILLIEDLYDEFEAYFVKLYTDSLFPSVGIDVLLSEMKSWENAENSTVRRKESLLHAVELLYDSESKRLGQDTLQLQFMRESMETIKNSL